MFQLMSIHSLVIAQLFRLVKVLITFVARQFRLTHAVRSIVPSQIGCITIRFVAHRTLQWSLIGVHQFMTIKRTFLTANFAANTALVFRCINVFPFDVIFQQTFRTVSASAHVTHVRHATGMLDHVVTYQSTMHRFELATGATVHVCGGICVAGAFVMLQIFTLPKRLVAHNAIAYAEPVDSTASTSATLNVLLAKLRIRTFGNATNRARPFAVFGSMIDNRVK